MRKKLLLHSCCAPCSTSVLERLTAEYDVGVFYYNPNIYPADEYAYREREQEEFLSRIYGGSVEFVEGVYDTDKFYAAVKGLEREKEGGERCRACYRLRLEETARTAAEKGYDIFATTLSVSPYKKAAVLNELGAEVGKMYGVEYLVSDFKKKDGYLRSIRLSKEYGLYRQDYCGCVYSVRRDNGKE